MLETQVEELIGELGWEREKEAKLERQLGTRKVRDWAGGAQEGV